MRNCGKYAELRANACLCHFETPCVSFMRRFTRKRRFTRVCAMLWSTPVHGCFATELNPAGEAEGGSYPAVRSSWDGEVGSHGDGSNFGERSGPGCSSRMVGPPWGARKDGPMAPRGSGLQGRCFRSWGKEPRGSPPRVFPLERCP